MMTHVINVIGKQRLGRTRETFLKETGVLGVTILLGLAVLNMDLARTLYNAAFFSCRCESMIYALINKSGFTHRCRCKMGSSP